MKDAIILESQDIDVIYVAIRAYMRKTKKELNTRQDVDSEAGRRLLNDLHIARRIAIKLLEEENKCN